MTASDYAVARARGARSRLLGRAGLHELLLAPGLAERLERLRSSVWRTAVPSRGEPAASAIAAFERGLAVQLSADLSRAARWLDEGFSRSRERTSGRSLRLLAAAFAADEAWTVIAVLRMLGKGAPASRLSPWLAPTPGLPSGAVATLAASASVGEAVERLVSWGSPLADALLQTLPRWRAGGGTRALEAAAERAAFEWGFEMARGVGEDAAVVRGHLARQADLANARRLLEGARASEGFVAGGEALDRDRFMRIAALDRDARHAALTGRRGPFAQAGLRAVDLQDPFRAEARLRAIPLMAMREEAMRRPLSLAVLLRWLFERRAEAAGLRLVLRATAYGIPPASVVPLLEGT